MEPFRITRLEMQDIGPFGRLVLDFPEKPVGSVDKAEIHILTGENGTGKTTILEALSSTYSRTDGINLPAIKSRLEGNHSGFMIYFGKDGVVQFIPNLSTYSYESKVERIETGYRQGFNTGFYSVAFFAYAGYRRIGDNVKISGINELQGHPFQGALKFQNSEDPQAILQWIANTITKEALAKSELDPISSKRFRDAISHLEVAISVIIEKTVRFSLRYDPLHVVIEVDGEILDFNVLPDGLKSIISWIADLLMRMDRVKWENDIPVLERNFILFLDEIEVHMHPAWQRKILPAVQDLFPNAQIFISTHSPFVVGSVDGAWIHKLVKPNGDSQLAEGYPMLSEDARSYRYWLDEVFGIKEQFGPEVERDMGEFYALRNRILRGENGNVPAQLLEIGKSLAVQSEEVNQIIQMEIRQINRQKGLQLSL
ncbi:MAG: AAA family ATPase [Saprospiraceae bacterium]